MPCISTRLLLWASLLHITSTSALSLSEFVPKAQNLTQGCQDVYTSTVDGCEAQDFAQPGQCSVSCLAGLASIQIQVINACKDDPQNNNQIIGSMLTAEGISILCGNGQAPSPSETPEPSAEPTTATPTSRPSSTPQPSSSEADTMMTTATTAPSTEAPSSTKTPAMPYDTTTPTRVPSTMVSSAVATPTSTVDPAQASAQAAAASLCEKGDSSEHGGSLMDTQCSSASRLSRLSLAGLDQQRWLAWLMTFGLAVAWV